MTSSIASLTGTRVVDLTSNVAGPFASQVLGDLGAEVIKIERPGTGDDTRGWGPPFWADQRTSVTYAALNRNKRSVALDLKEEADREILDELIATADILIENLRPGAFARVGYTKHRLGELNERLIYCRITGFGEHGDRRMEPAYDPLIQAFSGLMSLVGEEGGAPCRVPVSILDQGSGLWAVIGILNALRLRDQGRVGLDVHTSLLETALQWQPNALLGYLASGVVPQRTGSSAAMISPYQAFETADDYIVVAAGNDRLWARLATTLERSELLADPRFATNADRVTHRAELTAQLTASFRTAGAVEWVQRLTTARIPCARINTIDQVVADPQVEATGAFVTADDGELHYLRTPIATNGRRFDIRLRPPELDSSGPAIRSEVRDRRSEPRPDSTTPQSILPTE